MHSSTRIIIRFSVKVDGSSFALAHNGVLWNDKELRMEESLPMTSVETDSYVAVQLLEQQKTLDFDSLKFMAEKVEGSFVFTVLDKANSIWFVVGDNPLCVMFYDGFLIYASTQEILCKTIKKLRIKAPSDILEPQEGEIMQINRNGPYHYRQFYAPHDVRALVAQISLLSQLLRGHADQL